jgi:hypothetical protein
MESGRAEVDGEEDCHLVESVGNTEEACGVDYPRYNLHFDADRVKFTKVRAIGVDYTGSLWNVVVVELRAGMFTPLVCACGVERAILNAYYRMIYLSQYTGIGDMVFEKFHVSFFLL